MKKYNKYKDSGIEWIGEIPSHWEVKKVKHSFTFKTGFTPPTGKSEYYENGNHVWINISDLQEKYIEDSSNKITDKAIKDYNPEIVEKGSLLYSFKLSVGRVGFNTIDCYTNEAIFAIDPNSSANLHFFYYSLPEQIIKNANENIYGAKILNQELIKNAFLVVPPPKEQTAITNYLDRKTAEIDELIADKKRLLELYEEEKTAIINQAVTKGINPDVKMKDSGIEWLGEIPEHWEVKRFDFLFKFSRGLSITKADLLDEGIPCVTYGEIHSKYPFELTPEIHPLKCVTSSYIETHQKSLIKRGDFVFADTSEDIVGSGNFTYLNSDISVFAGYHTIIAIPQIKFISRFVAYYFETQNYRNQIRSQVVGTKVYSITQAILKFTNIVLPPIDEQEVIVNFIDERLQIINAKITKTEKLIELLSEYKTALISEVVTGKVKVCG